jgi:hypothetical protein
VPSFTEALCAVQSMRAFMYAHDITERDQANIVNTEGLFVRCAIIATQIIRPVSFEQTVNSERYVNDISSPVL